MIYLGINIKEYRLKRGYTQEQLAYELGVSSQTVSRWENGTTYPDIVMLPVMADFFNISIDKLMGYAQSIFFPFHFHSKYLFFLFWD